VQATAIGQVRVNGPGLLLRKWLYSGCVFLKGAIRLCDVDNEGMKEIISDLRAFGLSSCRNGSCFSVLPPDSGPWTQQQ